MSHSPAGASGDEPLAAPGQTTEPQTAEPQTTPGQATLRLDTGPDPTLAGLCARMRGHGDLSAEDIAALARLDDGPGPDADAHHDDRGRDADSDDRRLNADAHRDCAEPHADAHRDCAEPHADANRDNPEPEADVHPYCPQPAGHPSGDTTSADLDDELPMEWLALPDEEYAALMDDADGPPVAEALEAGFTHHIPTPGATGFTSGGPLDVMLAGSDLAWHAAQARRRGLGALSDSELCGIMGAARRLESWAAGLKLAAVNELDVRRAEEGGRPGEHVADETAAVLVLTPRAASDVLGLARNLARVPQTRALLAAGILDEDRAAVIADALAVLDAAGAAIVENQITPDAAEKTTGQLRAACERAIKAYDPQAATRRREQAQKDARVECWAEAAGTSAIAGRDLPPAGVIAADKTLDADARWLRQHGMPGSHDERRAAAFLARLTNRPLDSLLPRSGAADGACGPSAPAPGPSTPASGPSAPAPGPSTPASGSSAPASGPSTGGPSPATAASGLAGSVNLTMPASAWLGLSDAPGEAGGPGALDADTCRDLATALAANPATRWCVTIVDRHGRATAHGCARAGPGPPGGTNPVAWLTAVKITPIEIGTCSHRRESAGYQPSNMLRHIIKVRSPRCGFPGCRRPAVRCDDDHTVPYDQGGRTCECNLHPLCRRHHQAKQAPGWRLEQPEPGVLVWTLPSGRQYRTTAEPYPA
jgi:hypothetical protein